MAPEAKPATVAAGSSAAAIHAATTAPAQHAQPAAGTVLEPPTIPEFYAGRDIFVTGGTGFMGKILVEKLLFSCPDVARIFLLVRSRHAKNAQERVAELLQQPVFDRLRAAAPHRLDRVFGIDGDVCALGLGLSAASLERMAGVSVIFHSAASVRFDDPLHQAVLMNTRGTRELLQFAERLTGIRVVVHVSTTYCNPHVRSVYEHVYPPNGDWRTAIRLAETQPELMDTLQLKITNYEPNTYTFTKGLSEQVVNDYRDRLPVVIYRPSIVICAMDEPIPGWVDNFNGPVGLLMACGIGIMRTTFGDPDVVSDFIPVDTSIKAMLVAAWHKAVGEPDEQRNGASSTIVYNGSTSLQRKFTTGFIVQMGEELAADTPFDKMLWKPGGCITKCRYNNYIKFIVFHLLVAYVVDAVFKLTSNKPFLVKMQRRIYNANVSLEIFIRTSWTFHNDRFRALHERIPPGDLDAFRYDRFVTVDARQYLTDCVLGARRFLLNEPDENIPRAQRNYRRMWWVDAVTRCVVYGLLFWWISGKLLLWQWLV